MLRNAAAIGLTLSALLLIGRPALADTAECVINPGPPIEVKDKKTAAAIGQLTQGDFVYARWPEIPTLELFIVREDAFRAISGIDVTRLDCDSSGKHRQFPIAFSGAGGRQILLRNFGIFYGGSGPRPKSAYACPYIGDGHVRAHFTSDTMKRYTSRGFSLETLCMTLTSGQVRFDPETGRRLPTYVVIDRSFDGGTSISPEVPFEAPPCFSRGAATFKGFGARMSPLGCAVKFHPWSGRKLSSAEALFFTKYATLAAAGDAGESIEDSKKMATDPNRRPTAQLLQSIKNAASPRPQAAR